MTNEYLYFYKAVVQRVIDGDTVEVSVDLGFSTYRRDILRLYGINTPELNSRDAQERERAQAARDFLREVVFADPWVTIKTHKDQGDKYGRMLAEIYLIDGSYVNELMVVAGHAVRYMV